MGKPEGESSSVEMCERCLSKDLGILEVPVAEGIMSAARGLRLQGELPDLLLFMAHPRTVAVGLRDYSVDHPDDLLISPMKLQQERIALTRSIRGGGITYHWPGQVACYPVIQLRPSERDIPKYMNRLEQVAIDTLKSFGVNAARRGGRAAYIGLWHEDRKVVSMGVRVSRWVTSFGFAINLEGNHGPSRYVRPCGLEGVKLVTLEEILGQAPPRVRVVEQVKECFASAFDRTLGGLHDSFLPSLLRLTEAGGMAQEKSTSNLRHTTVK